ncbi:hypothetical protein C0J52_26189 [Blattella germanica]|nr:hypothetical protein C0J52_26189 [Blattella germanica]
MRLHFLSGRSSRLRNSKDEQRSGSEPPSPTHEPPPSPSRRAHQKTCQELGLDFPNDQDNALKAKKKILLSSLCSTSDWKEENNAFRLGPSKNNVFECLHKSPVTSPRANDEHKSLSNEILQCKQSEETPELENLVRTNGKSLENVESESKTSPGHGPNRPIEIKNDISNEVSDSVQLSKITQVIKAGAVNVSETIVKEITNVHNLSTEVDSLPKLEVWLPHEDKECVISNNERNDQNTQGNMSPSDVFHDVQDMVVMDLDEEDSVPEFLEISVAHTPVKLATAVELKKVVLGSSMANFSPQWLGQGFMFNTNHKLRYGFVQRKGGSCGVLATVQAFLLKILLFEQGACSCTEPLRPTRKEACSALVRALGDVLWRAGLGESAVLALCSDISHLGSCTKYSQDGLTERLNLTSFNSREHLEAGIKNNLDQFTNMTGNGCLLLLFSAVLSRGLHRVKNDMDEYSPLIGNNGQCTLELVNLLLTGYAVSNVFDNSLQVDSCWLRGVNTRADVGFLSLFEHYNSCQVGSYLKTPRFPIWVVCSENHFSVLFSCRRELVSDWKAERRFHLYYYDGMARQEDEIKLTVGRYSSSMQTMELYSQNSRCIFLYIITRHGTQSPLQDIFSRHYTDVPEFLPAVMVLSIGVV